jgi:ADP-glucose pyrophosphorylase
VKLQLASSRTKSPKGHSLFKTFYVDDKGNKVKQGPWVNSASNVDDAYTRQISMFAELLGNTLICGKAEINANCVINDSYVGNNCVITSGCTVYQSSLSGNVKIYNNATIKHLNINESITIKFDINDGIIIYMAASSGYKMLLDEKNGKISAGCRYMTFKEAKNHCKNNHRDTILGKEYLAMIKALKAIYKARKAAK